MDKDTALAIARRYTGTSIEGLSAIWDLCHGHDYPPGSVVECGVVNGGTAVLIWAAVGAGRDLWMFDSWEGLPPPGHEDGGRAGSQYDYHMATQGAWCKGDIEKAAQAAREIGCKRANLVKGWFVDTLPEFASRTSPISCLHIDADWYNSVKDCLLYLWPEVATGGLVIFNDYGYWPGCTKAVDEFLCGMPGLVVTPPCGAWIIKP